MGLRRPCVSNMIRRAVSAPKQEHNVIKRKKDKGMRNPVKIDFIDMMLIQGTG